jgi:hypothetical protein
VFRGELEWRRWDRMVERGRLREGYRESSLRRIGECSMVQGWMGGKGWEWIVERSRPQV